MGETRPRRLGRNLVLLLIGCLLGIYLGKVFAKGIKVPYVQPQLEWSIGIYAGKSPFNFVSHPGAKNPVLTARDVSDVPSLGVADPFMFFENGQWYLFMEVLNKRSKKGEIGLATSKDGTTWRYQEIVLAEPFHLSFPYVFQADGAYFMIPETTQTHSVRLYRALEFPRKWTLVGVLLPERLTDPCLFQHRGKWWLFGCRIPEKGNLKKGIFLELFSADRLLGPWVRHPRSPVASGARATRPGGRVITSAGRLIRYAQDDYPYYGREVRALEISRLTPTEYEEKEIPLEPPVKDSGRGWNGKGMHHLDPHPLADGSWIACVDGREWVLNFGWK